MKIALWILGGVSVAAVAVWLIGSMLPVAHLASRSAAFEQSAETLYTIIADTRSYREWLDDDTPVVVVETQPPSRLVTRVAGDDLPFGGTWTFEITREDKGSRVTIIERGEVYNPIFRVMSRYVFGHTATIDKFLAALAARVSARG